jgi:heme/copper-type cytochrome/quinol oxidase subunit 3
MTTAIYIVTLLIGLGFMGVGVFMYRRARNQGSSTTAALSTALVFFMIGLVAVVIGGAMLTGVYLREPPTSTPTSPYY